MLFAWSVTTNLSPTGVGKCISVHFLSLFRTQKGKEGMHEPLLRKRNTEEESVVVDSANRWLASYKLSQQQQQQQQNYPEHLIHYCWEPMSKVDVYELQLPTSTN